MLNLCLTVYIIVCCEEESIYFDLSMLKLRIENTGFVCYPKFVYVHFDLFIDLQEYDNYFVINRGACMLATLKIKNKTFNN